jgi:diaminopimelate epimerase
MHFSKLASAGLDYICIDNVSTVQPHDLNALSRAMCDRHYGAGAGGLIVLERSSAADVRVRRFRPDGSPDDRGSIGLGTAAAFAYQRGLAPHPQVRVERGSEIAYVTVAPNNKDAWVAHVDLGPPQLQAERIPTTLPGNPPVEVPVTFPDTMHNVTVVSMGDPYAVIFVRELSDALVQTIGPTMENHPGFPQRTNVAFVKATRPESVTARVWREVVSTGLGAAAIAVAGSLTGKTSRQLTAHFPGGDLNVEWSSKDNHVYLNCAIACVYEGDWPDHA